MGGIAGVFSKSEIDAPRLVVKMLRAMEHRAQDGAAVSCDGGIESAHSPNALRESSVMQHSAVGYCFTRVLPRDVLQPIPVDAGWLVFDGRIILNQTLAGGEEAADLLQPYLTPTEFPSIQRKIDGAYSVCLCMKDGLYVTRDPLGLKPLFLAHQGDLTAIASDRKALWAIGLRSGLPFPPGGCMIANPERIAFGPRPSAEEGPSVEAASPDELLRVLEDSVSIQTSDISKIAIGFSGGLDSGVIAKIAKDAGADVLAVTIGVGRPPEVEQAERAAAEIGIPIAVRTFSEEEVEESVDRVLWLIEEPNLMKVSVAVAVNWVTQIAFKKGRNVVLLGQGSDELFGGYRRFATILGERGTRAAEEAILESIRNAHEVNCQRDEQAISDIRAELRLPFATRKMTELALRTPVGMKVRSPSDDLRKWILRETAIKLGVPSTIALRHKKAIQHASGIEKTIRAIARRHHRIPSSYLEESFRRMKGRAAA